MTDQTKNLLIGLFTIAAIGITTYIILFLHPSMGDEGQILHVRFTNIDKVSIGTRVLFAGHPVGEVIDIKEVEGARGEGQVKDGEVYIYELTLQLDSNVKVFTSDKIMVSTSGLLGERSIAVDPQPPKPGQPLIRVTDQVFYASSPGSVEEAIQTFGNVAEDAKRVLGQISEQLETIDEGFFWENLSTTASNLADITSALNQPDDWSTIVTSIREISENLNETWPKIESTIDSVNAIVDNVKEGNGTLGRLLVRDDMYLQAKSIFNKAETLMDDINHYGILFQNDKSWQRLRARRASLMQQLDTPQAFYNFFNDELAEINTSISRVSNIMGQAECGCCPEILSSYQYSDVFADLMRKVEALEEHIQNYNEQLCEIRENRVNAGAPSRWR